MKGPLLSCAAAAQVASKHSLDFFGPSFPPLSISWEAWAPMPFKNHSHVNHDNEWVKGQKKLEATGMRSYSVR